MYFYELKTGAIWASKEPVQSKKGRVVGQFYKVRNRHSEPSVMEVYDVVFAAKSVACLWSKVEQEGQLFGKVNPNHKKVKDAGTNA